MNFSEWAFHDVEHIYLQLIQKIEYAILSKQLSAGEELPSVRKMANILQINPNTVSKAYKLVSESGLIVSSRNGHYCVVSNKQYICHQREETAKILCCSYLRNMLSLGFSKNEANDFFIKYSSSMKESNI